MKLLTSAFTFIMIFATSILQGQTEMNYYISKTVNYPFEEASVKITEALKVQEFGIVTTIEMHEKLAEKIDNIDVKPYRILGACNPEFAYETLKAEENIGLFLPCKVLIKYIDENTTEVVMVDPSVLMSMLGNKELEGVANEVTVRFKKAVESL